MNQLLILTSIILTIVGFEQRGVKNNVDKATIKSEEIAKTTISKKNQKQKDENIHTVIVCWQSEFDTVIVKKVLNIENESYELELKSFCLNDSSIIRWNDLNKPTIYKDIYHDYVCDLTLIKGIDTILIARINKELFKDSLDGDFYSYSVLKGIKFEFARSNRLYFKTTLNVPDADWMIENDFAIFFRTN